MNGELLIGLISLGGTFIGSISGILAANRLSSYRILQLEKKVDKHNNLVERVASVEQCCQLAHRRIDES